MTVADRIDRCLVRTMGPHLERTMPTPTASLGDDLEMDSLDLVELVMNLEQEFKLQITEEQGDRLRTWGDVIKLVTKLVQEKQERDKEAASGISSNERKQYADAAGTV